MAGEGCGGDPTGDDTLNDTTRAAAASIFREEAGRLTARLIGVLGDFDLAEELVQEALLAALERWPVEGIPANPRAWLHTVAQRRGIDRLRREITYRSKLRQLGQPAEQEPDNRLELIFLCCHPALAPEAQVALTLRAVCGLTTAEIAAAFIVSESTVSQRLLRARKKIGEARIPYRVPDADELDERLTGVLAVLYLLFNEGYLASGGAAAERRDLAEEAAWLADLVVHLFPLEPEPLGLLALMRLHLARGAARFDAAGELVLLPQQDRSRWNRAAIAEAVGVLERAAALRRPGPYQLQAAIAACHSEAADWEATDWPQILILYDMLLELAPSPVVRLNRAVALRQVAGSGEALADILPLASVLDCYHLFHAIHAQLLLDQGDHAQAHAAEMRALALTHNQAERSLLRQRLAACH
jgi:RNA polymerase sigma factor (sigma-70 family)